MKKLTVLAATFMFLLAFTQVQANSVKETKLRSEIKTNREDLRKERRERREMNENMVSDLSKDNFYSDFGNVGNVKWTRENDFDVATFMNKGQKERAFYDYDSNLIGTTSLKKFADLPMQAQNTIKKEYKKYRIGDVIYFKDNEDNDTDMILWDTQFADADNYFVELRSPKHHIIVQVDPQGEVFFFKDLNA